MLGFILGFVFALPAIPWALGALGLGTATTLATDQGRQALRDAGQWLSDRAHEASRGMHNVVNEVGSMFSGPSSPVPTTRNERTPSGSYVAQSDATAVAPPVRVMPRPTTIGATTMDKRKNKKNKGGNQGRQPAPQPTPTPQPAPQPAPAPATPAQPAAPAVPAAPAAPVAPAPQGNTPQPQNPKKGWQDRVGDWWDRQASKRVTGFPFRHPILTALGLYALQKPIRRYIWPLAYNIHEGVSEDNPQYMPYGMRPAAPGDSIPPADAQTQTTVVSVPIDTPAVEVSPVAESDTLNIF